MSPIVATVIGDPCGVGPEVVLKSLADLVLPRDGRPLLVGSRFVKPSATGLRGALPWEWRAAPCPRGRG